MSVLAGHFSDHLKELRRRVLVSFVAIVLASLLAYVFSETLVAFCLRPLRQAYPDLVSLIYTNLTEAFVSYLKLSVLVGLLAAFPVLCYQFWMFVAPGMMGREKRLLLAIVFWGSALFAAGASFAYFAVLPEILGFLMNFAGERLQPLPKLGAYLTFVARTSLAFGLAFEIPFLMTVAGRTGLVGDGYFALHRKYYYLAILVLSFLLTVGDVFSAVLLAFPLFALYEAGLVAVKVFGR